MDRIKICQKRLIWLNFYVLLSALWCITCLFPSCNRQHDELKHGKDRSSWEILCLAEVLFIAIHCIVEGTHAVWPVHIQAQGVSSSVAVLAEILLRSPRKVFVFTIKKCIYRIKVSKNKFIWFWKKLHWFPALIWAGMQNTAVNRLDLAVCARARRFKCNLRMYHRTSFGEALCLWSLQSVWMFRGHTEDLTLMHILHSFRRCWNLGEV